MKKTILTLALSLIFLVGFGLTAYAETAKAGKTSGKNFITATLKELRMDPTRVQINYEAFGIYMSDIKADILHKASGHAVGALHAVKGVFSDSGMIVFTVPKGDKIFLTYKVTGKFGQTATGTVTYVGGTGPYVGITGSGTLTRYPLQPPAEGMSASYSRITTNWQ